VLSSASSRSALQTWNASRWVQPHIYHFYYYNNTLLVQGASADKLQGKAAKLLSLVGLARSNCKQAPINRGTALSIRNAPRQPGPLCTEALIIVM
jgi:hypothetical protein